MDSIAAPRRRAAKSSAPTPIIVSQPDAWAYVGLSRAEWFRLKSAGKLPDPVFMPGSTWPKWRKADLDKWVSSLPSTRA